MKAKVLFFVIALISLVLLSSCGSSSFKKEVEVIDNSVVENNDVNVAISTTPLLSLENEPVLFYNPDLDLLFSKAETKEQKKAVWLKVKAEGIDNWLEIKAIYQNKWLVTKDSATNEWLRIKDKAFDTFKKEDPDAYQAYVALEEARDWEAKILFGQTTTSVAYKKYEKEQLAAWRNSEDIQLKAWRNSEDMQLKAWRNSEDMQLKAWRIYENAK